MEPGSLGMVWERACWESLVTSTGESSDWGLLGLHCPLGTQGLGTRWNHLEAFWDDYVLEAVDSGLGREEGVLMDRCRDRCRDSWEGWKALVLMPWFFSVGSSLQLAPFHLDRIIFFCYKPLFVISISKHWTTGAPRWAAGSPSLGIWD